jgi:tetratricopeptide (TPR) repeat protein
MFFDLGLCHLARHNPHEAARNFEKALRECPASRGSDLYRICFFLGVALKRLGHPDPAIKSWMSCQRLKKRGHTRKLLSRLTNSYGMEKQNREELDDWKAFTSVQLTRYLLSKNKRAFSTRAERDMVLDLIKDYWGSLMKSGALEGKSCAEKHAVFTRVQIVFPTVLVPMHSGERVIPVNFRTQKKVQLSDRCSCGSGLPFHRCCGRTPGSEEIINGLF